MKVHTNQGADVALLKWAAGQRDKVVLTAEEAMAGRHREGQETEAAVR